MESRTGNMGRTSAIAKAAAAAAFTILINSFGLQGQPLHTGMGVDQPDPSFFINSFDSLDVGEPQGVPGAQGKSQSKGQGGPSQVSVLPEESFGRDNHRRRHERQLRLGPDRMKKGTKIWLDGHLKSTMKIYVAEINTHQSIPSHSQLKKDGPKVDVMTYDVMEIFAGRGRISELAPAF